MVSIASTVSTTSIARGCAARTCRRTRHRRARLRRRAARAAHPRSGLQVVAQAAQARVSAAPARQPAPTSAPPCAPAPARATAHAHAPAHRPSRPRPHPGAERRTAARRGRQRGGCGVAREAGLSVTAARVAGAMDSAVCGGVAGRRFRDQRDSGPLGSGDQVDVSAASNLELAHLPRN